MKTNIQEHTQVDKSFTLKLEDLGFLVFFDYDDVDHAEVDAVALHLKEIIEANWDSYQYQNLFQRELIKIWDNDKYLREDFENDMEAYLKSRLPEPRPDASKDFKDVVINTEDRFVGWYLGYRVSAVRLEGKDVFEYDISEKNGMVVEAIQSFDNMNALLFDVKHRIRCL